VSETLLTLFPGLAGLPLAAAFSVACIGLALVFFLAGSVGLLRLPDLHCRLHALTKADNLGLGLLVLGLLPWAPDVTSGLKLVLVWLLVLAASAAGSHLIARHALRREEA
jgi:multicomponent Na+:H+ antiporter subunit G